MVGDRAQDVIGAHTHGMRSIGVRWGYAEPGELEAAQADVSRDDGDMGFPVAGARSSVPSVA